MKKTLVMLSVAAALAAGFSSCKKDADPTRNDMIIGTWNLTGGTSVENDTIITVYTPEVTSGYNTLKNTNEITQITKTYTSTGYIKVKVANTGTYLPESKKETTSYTFKEDGTYSLNTTSTEVTTSTTPETTSEKHTGYWFWLSSTEDQKIIMVDGSQLIIKSLSGSELITESKTTTNSVKNDPEYASRLVSSSATTETKIARKYTHNNSTTSTMTYAKAQ